MCRCSSRIYDIHLLNGLVPLNNQAHYRCTNYSINAKHEIPFVELTCSTYPIMMKTRSTNDIISTTKGITLNLFNFRTSSPPIAAPLSKRAPRESTLLIQRQRHNVCGISSETRCWRCWQLEESGGTWDLYLKKRARNLRKTS